ncbi:uncharacterized protein LOC135466416 [Liolophura sinensis]|uniref:uncharacterized protein LOC135466416 n=1 Tax=Liolophura sinensis TaxID=3198878 RepID=UPI003158B477
MIKLITVAVLTAIVSAQPEAGMRPYGKDEVTPVSLPQKTPARCTTITCFKPLMSNGGNVSLGGPETWSATELKNKCQMFSTARSCISESVVTCPESIQTQSNIFIQMIDYICKDVFDEMVELSSCTGSPKAKSDVQQCIDGIAQAQAAMLHSDTGVSRVQAQCRILSEYEACVIDVEGEDCGERAQELYMRIFNKVNQIVSEEINCTSENQEPETDNLYPKEAEVCVAAASSCLRHLETYRTSMADFDVNELPKICRAFSVAEHCMDTNAAECEATQEWEILGQSFAAICNPNTLMILQRPNACLNSTLLTSKLDNCESSELQSESDLEDERTCQILEEYLSCYAKSVEQTCPPEIAEAVESVLEGVSGIIELERSVDCQPEINDPESEDEPEVSEELAEECAPAIAKCLQPLEPHRKGFTSFQLETIPQVCSDFGRVEACMEETMQACESTQEWKIIENAFSQICMPDVTEGVTDCPVRSDVVTKLRSCEKDELKAEVKIDNDRTCQVLQEYVNCYSITIDRECEEKDGQLVSQVMSGVAQVIQLDKEVICEDVSEEDGDSDEQGDESQGTTVINDDEDEEERRMEETWGPLAPCVGFMAEVQLNPLPIHHFSTLAEFCEQARESSECAQGELHLASDYVRENWKQLMTAVKFVCFEKRQAFNEVYPCLVERVDSNTCYDEVPMAETEDYDDANPLCRMVNDFENCIASLAEETCGMTAGGLMRALSAKMNDLLAKDYHISCPFQSENNDLLQKTTKRHKIIIGVSVGGSLALLIVTALVVVSCWLRSRRSHSLDKKELVKNDILQQNIQIGLQKSDKKDSDVAILSVSKLDI